jgi:hypothetical protein
VDPDEDTNPELIIKENLVPFLLNRIFYFRLSFSVSVRPRSAEKASLWIAIVLMPIRIRIRIFNLDADPHVDPTLNLHKLEYRETVFYFY